ncbi:unnamed protein product [Meloidogyne enterolobii]|uniref:Uncharacterized protein n=1 Tax=Meloidogyne enterolobii TaxID=390850 RepID=A0ACB0Y0Q7_MELEN
MRLDRILIILIVNAIFWSLINSVKNNKEQNELSRVGETSKDLTINDGAESSVDPRIQKYERTLKPKPKIAKKGTTKDKKEEKKFNKSENNKEKRREADRKYRAKNKEKKREYDRKYRENNREKKRECDRKYVQNNREKRREAARNYYQNNKENRKEFARKYREKMKNKNENLKNADPKVGHINSDNNEGTSCLNTQEDFRNKGKLPIVYEEGIQVEEGCLLNQEEEECNKDEAETYMEEQNQTVVEEPTKINSINQIDSDEEDYLIYLNDKPEDEDEDDC